MVRYTSLRRPPRSGRRSLVQSDDSQATPMDNVNQRISDLCSAIIQESNPAEVIRLSAELNRLLADKIDETSSPADPSPEPA
jgi:hypothetical protein